MSGTLSAQSQAQSLRYFDTTFYLNSNPDVLSAVAAGRTTAFQHFVTFGHRENRTPTSLFNANAYLASNPDIALAVGSGRIVSAWDHFVNVGIVEGRSNGAFTGTFNSAAYLAANPDVAAAVSGTNPNFRSAYEHFLLFGQAEGRAATNTAGQSITTNPGQTFTLTTNVDGPGAVAPAVDTNGTAGNDRYNAADTTLQSADSINGAGGTDTLAIRAAATGTAAPVLTSVEIVEITNVSGASYTLNAVSATGMTTATVKDTTVAGSLVEFENLATTVTGRLDNGDVTAEFNYSGAASRTGTADAVALQIANGSGTATTASLVRYTNGAAAADATFENVNITASGAASNVNFGNGNASFRVINVSGDAAVGTTVSPGGVQNYGLSIGFADTAATAMRTVNASSMTGTGGLNIDLTGSTQTTVAFTGSAQNDRVAIDGTIANAANTFSLNAGSGGANDILAMDDIVDFTAATVARQTINSATGFETLEATAGDVTALNADQFTSINSFVFSGAQTAGNAVTNLRTGDSVAYTVDSTRAGDVITLSGAVAGQSATVTLTGGVDLTATGAGNALTVNSGLTSVAIVSSNVQGLATAAAVNTITAATTVAAIDNVSASTFTASGAAGLTIGAVAGLAAPLGFTNTVSFDASALTGVLRIAGSASADVIQGGSAADIIYGLGGNDELRGNGGADQFRFLANTDGTDVIRDFTVGTDKIGIADAVINFAGTAATQAGAQIAATDYEAGRNDITNIVAGDTLKVIELQTGLTTAQISAQVGAAADAVVLVFNTTTGKGEMWYDSDWSGAAGRVQLATFDNVTTLVGVQGFSALDFVNFAV